jgi:hypothetical protein
LNQRMNSTLCSGRQPCRNRPADPPEWIIPIEPAGSPFPVTRWPSTRGASSPCCRTSGPQRFTAQQTLDLPGQVVLPGLINLHTHAAMSLLRGYADDLPLMRWLSERIWPAEARHATPEFVHAGTLLACAEMLRGGITTFNDMYFFPDAAAAAARRLGMRAVLGIIAIEFPTRYAADADDYLAKGLEIRDTLRGDPLVGFCLAPHAPYTVADKTFEKIATLAAQLEIPIHMHVHETLARNRGKPGKARRAPDRTAAPPGPARAAADRRACRASRCRRNRPAGPRGLPPRALPDLQPEARQRHPADGGDARHAA